MRNLLLIIFVLLFFPLLSWAAVLYLEPAEGEYYQGDTFIINIRIDPEKECINTVKADISFPPDLLEALDFSQGNTILTVFPEAPEIQKDIGLVSFSGGIPGGYCGILPGDPGESNLLGRIIFKVKEIESLVEANSLPIEFLNTSQVLLNDGKGTSAELSSRKAIFTFLSGVPEVYKKEWQEELAKDKTPPEPFEIEINQEPSTFEGKYFITFNTTDKQAGVDYYQVKEGNENWKKVVSPHVLDDQSLESIIKVRAVDKAGNERIAEYTSLEKFIWWWLIIVLIGVVAIIWFVKWRIKISNLK